MVGLLFINKTESSGIYVCSNNSLDPQLTVLHIHFFILSRHSLQTYTSDVLEHKWRASLKTILLILTSNTEATGNKVQFFNFAYRVKGFQFHSNNSLQLLGRKKTITIQYTLFKSFLCDILQLSSGCNTQCFDTTGHAPTQPYLRSSIVDNVFSSKYCCARLITMTKIALTYHRH